MLLTFLFRNSYANILPEVGVLLSFPISSPALIEGAFRIGIRVCRESCWRYEDRAVDLCPVSNAGESEGNTRQRKTPQGGQCRGN